MLLTLIEQKINILIVNHFPDSLFLMRGKFYPSSWIWVFVVFKTGACFESRFYWKLKICNHGTSNILMQDLWAKDIVDSIWTTLCSFVQSYLIW